MIQDVGHCLLHCFKVHVPIRKSVLFQKLPEPFNLVQIGRIGWQELELEHHTVLLFHPCDPRLDQHGMVITGVIQIDDESLHLRVNPVHLSEQANHFLGVQVFLGYADIKVFMIFRTDRPQNVQPLAAASHTDVKSLTSQKPAAMHQFNTPDRIRAIQEIASGGLVFRLLPPIASQICFVSSDRL